jgi:hypothetical protein
MTQKTETATPRQDREAVAAKFTELLAVEIGPENMAAVVILNQDTDAIEKAQGEDETMSCASYNFCDADMVMAQAFKALGLPQPDDLADQNERENAWDLWVDAWTLAQRHHFQAYRKPLPMGPANNDT